MGTSPFQKIYPAILEKSVAEVGDLIGRPLELQDKKSGRGSGAEIFAPPKQKFGMAAFHVKNAPGDPVCLVFDLDLAIELAGRLIMLPSDEIQASKKTGELDGDLLDAFSEIANILSSVINTTFQDSLAGAVRSIRLVRGEVQVFSPKTADIPLPSGNLTSMSASLILKGQKIGFFQFFFPESLLEENHADAGADAKSSPADKDGESTGPAWGGRGESGREAALSPASGAESIPEEAFSDVGADDAPDDASGDGIDGFQAGEAPGKADPEIAPGGADPAFVSGFLSDALDPAGEELEALLGNRVVFEERQTLWQKKSGLLARTKGKQVLTRIKVSGDRDGFGYMLLPLKDAVYFGGLLLMMPSDSITEVVKKGEFQGEVADAFGEIANILVGCYSNRFKSDFSAKLSLKKESLEAIVPAQADPAGNEPFPEADYFAVTARIRVGENLYGPVELFFPAGLLGLGGASGISAFREPGAGADKPGTSDGKSQKTVSVKKPGQKTDPVSAPETIPDIIPDSTPDPAPDKATRDRSIITVIAEEEAELEEVADGIREAGLEINRLRPGSALQKTLAGAETCCVLLLISKVNDQGLSRAIQVRAALHRDCPLVLGGPGWTRAMVIKALRYGVSDILVTPAKKEQVREKCRKYIQPRETSTRELDYAHE